MLDTMLKAMGTGVTHVVALRVAESLLEERICGRWVHEASGRSYHVKNKKPKSLKDGLAPSPETMLDDETGEPLMQRLDDTKETLKKRLEIYHRETELVLDHYMLFDVVRDVDSSNIVDPANLQLAIESALSEPKSCINKKPRSLKSGMDPAPETMMLNHETGSSLVQRLNDAKEALKQRLETYHRGTEPLLDHYMPRGVIRNTPLRSRF